MRRHAFWLLVAAFTFVGSAHPTLAQESPDPPPPCSEPEAREFDFWVGDWDLTWDGGKGTNTIRAILGGCVIEENFDGRGEDGSGLVGMSMSRYHAGHGVWKQTWVDNQGGYLDFTGKFEDGKMILGREANRDGVTFLQRMVFYNIGEQELDWSWERSDDKGETWKPLWVIHYTRSPSGEN